MPDYSFQQMIYTDSAFRGSKPNKSKLRRQTLLGAGALTAGIYLADKFEKKHEMTADKKATLETKARRQYKKIIAKIDEQKLKLKNNIKSLLGNKTKHFAPDKTMGKVFREPAKYVKKYHNKALKWVLSLSKSSKWIAGIVGVSLLVRHIKKSGEIEGKHKAINTIGRADNYLGIY